MNKNYDVIFESNNIYYVKMNENLLEDYLEMYTNLEVQKSLFKKSATREQLSNWLKKQITSDNGSKFSMIEKGTNKFIGNIEIIPKENNLGEVIMSITPAMQGKHFAVESIEAVVKYGYEVLMYDGFDLYVYKSNERAIHCYEKAGFTFNGGGISELDVNMVHSK